MDEFILVETKDGATSFQPGDVVAGTMRWQLPEAPETIELRLFWSTSGKGDQDLEVVESLSFNSPGAQGERPFQLRLPAGPYSFSGRLITLSWAVEAVALPAERAGNLSITVSPTGEEIRLHP